MASFPARLLGASAAGQLRLELEHAGESVVDAVILGAQPGSRLYGFEADELGGKMLSTFLPGRVLSAVLAAAAHLAPGAEPVTYQVAEADPDDGRRFRFSAQDLDGVPSIAWEHIAAEFTAADGQMLVATLLESTETAMVLASADGRILEVTRGFAEIAGRSPAELRRLWLRDLAPAVERSGSLSESMASIEQFGRGSVLHLERPDGSYRTVLGNYTALRDTQRRAAFYLGIYVDITERLRMEESYGHLMELLPEIVFRIRVDHGQLHLDYVSPAVLSILGYRPDEILRHDEPFDFFLHPEDEEAATKLVEGRSATLRFWHADGHWVHLECRARVEPEADGVMVLVGVAVDVTTLREGEEQLKHQAEHDGLTRLANRRMFTRQLMHALETDPKGVAVLFLDLDRFKKVNDSLGHAAGDQLLVQAATRLENTVRPHDLLARFGGDEFTVLLTALARETDAVAVAERLRQAMNAPFVLDGRSVAVHCSIGLAFADGDTTPSDLLRYADFALAAAKEQGRNLVRVFDEELSERLRERIGLEDALRTAVEHDEIFPVFQTEHDLQTGAVVGAEVLMRWRHPSGRVLTPVEFLAAADEIGLLPEMDRQVRMKALREAGRLRQLGLLPDDFVLRMNLSAGDFASTVRPAAWQELAADAGLPTSFVCLEVTETAIGLEVEELAFYVAQLRAAGLRVAIDDFGTGYSSLAYLEALPITDVKIDRRFVQRLGVSGPGRAVVQAIVVLCRALGLSVVAEGVEVSAERDALIELGIEHGQGYLFGEPVPLDRFESMVRASIGR